LAEYVRENLGIKRVMTVPNGSDPGLFRPDVSPVERVQRSPDRLNVVWIGSADLKWHNLELLRKTARLLWNQGKKTDVAFHIIGQGLGLMSEMPPNVNYYGPERYEMLPHWLASMDIGLILYRPGPGDMSSPLKLFDYMASGLAVVATPQPQVRDVFEELAQMDLMVPQDDAEALAAVLLRLASDRARIRQQGRLGRQRVVEHYNWRRAVHDVVDALEKLRHDRS
jgi:glycosyltransferase involved in cell wall biosynthesis